MAMIHQLVLVVLLAVYYVSVCEAILGCKDMNGNDVDWYYVYKLPKISSNPNQLIKMGVGHYYLDDAYPSFKLSQVSLRNQSQAVAQTMNQVYSLHDKIAYVMYNDEWPSGKVSNKGHTKGVLAFDSDTGFWLIHSVPKFPDNVSYSWPDNALTYGQSMLCITFKSSSMEDIGIQLLYAYPSVYDYNLPQPLSQLAPSLQDVVKGIHVKSPPWTKKVSLNSLQGEMFVHYAKSAEFGQDLYANFVAPDMETGLRTETWQNGRGKLSSNCTGEYDVLNIKTIAFPEVSFNSTKDHSKWAMTDSKLNGICVGGINRVDAQFHRGGGTMCAMNSKVWEQYQMIVAAVEDC